MSFCPGGAAKMREFLNKVDTLESNTIDEVTTITGKIKALEGNFAIEALIAIIPNGSKYEAALNSAMDKIVPALKTVQSVTEKISQWLNGKTDREAGGNLLVLASQTVSEVDSNKQKDSFYDTATQTHIEGLK
jgi:hypothetical protein